MIETITEEQLTPQQAEFWVRARQAVDMNNYPYAVSLLKALVKQLPGFLEGRKALRACEIKLNPEAKRGGLFSGMKISTSKLTSSKKDAATQLSALEDELENDPYSIPVNEALYTAAMEVNFPDLAAFALETVRQGHPGNKKMLHMLASHYVSRDMPAQAAEVYHDLVKLDPTDSVAVKSEKDCMARATMQQQKWEEAKSFRDVMKNSSETNTLDKSDKKGLTRAELEERLGLLSARYAQNQQDLAVVRDIAGVYEQMEDWANAYSFYNYAFSLSNNDISLENKASEMNERCRKAQVEEIAAALPRSRIIRNFRNSLPSSARKLRSSRWPCAASVWKTTPRTRKPVLSWARPSSTAAITRKPFRNSSAPATTPISASAPCCCSASAMTPRRKSFT